jgi:G3E family GTPase
VIPVTIIGGYLGAGKTTLVNHLLRHAAGRRLAVLVNDFGSLPIDADLIAARDGNLLSIAGGCICCSYGSDLVATLIELGDRGHDIDHVVIETSGVALPGAVAQSITLVRGLVLEGVIVLVDAETIESRAADVYLADTIERQIAQADLVLLTKLDLLDETARVTRRDWFARRWPEVRCLEMIHGAIDNAIVLGSYESSPMIADARYAAHDLPAYRRFEIALDGRVDVDAVTRSLVERMPDLLRAKGIVTDVDGQKRLVQIVGRRIDVTPAPTEAGVTGSLVCIAAPAARREVIRQARHIR